MKKETFDEKEKKMSHIKMCEKCKVNITTSDKKYCNFCFSKNNSRYENKKQSNENKIDFTSNRVKFMKTDNSSTNPLLWDDEKLKDEKRCFYCTKHLKEHDPNMPCKEKFQNYFSKEVRHLLFKNLTPPVRSSKPTGEAKHP